MVVVVGGVGGGGRWRGARELEGGGRGGGGGREGGGVVIGFLDLEAGQAEDFDDEGLEELFGLGVFVAGDEGLRRRKDFGEGHFSILCSIKN